MKAAKGMARIMAGRADLHEILCCLAGNPIMDDGYLAQHSINVTIFSIMLYRRLKYPVEVIITIAAGVLLRDTGMSMPLWRQRRNWRFIRLPAISSRFVDFAFHTMESMLSFGHAKL